MLLDMENRSVSPDAVLGELARILDSSLFGNAGRSRSLLTFLVSEAVNNGADRLKEYTIAVEALGKSEAFDPRTDPIVRAEASRLRSRLERYYATEGKDDPIGILLPKGGYAPQFLERSSQLSGPKYSRTDTAPEAVHSRRFIWLAAGAVAVICAFASGLFVARPSAHPAEPPLSQFDVEMRSRGTVGGEVGTSVILSPDGTRVVFVSIDRDGVTRLNTRRLHESHATEIAGTEGARGPFFSPDSRWVGFWSSDKLKKTAVEGGSPVVLCEATGTLGASWGKDGQIIAAMGERTLSRVSASGGQPSVILDLTKESVTPMWPQILPGERSVLFTAVGAGGPNHANIELLSLENGRRTVLVRGGTFGRFLPRGYLVYVNQGTLFAMPVDPDRPLTPGRALPVLEGVSYSSTFGFAEMDFSQTGVLAYRRNGGGEVTAQWIDRNGETEPFIAAQGNFLWPRLSPNGKRLVVSRTESGDSGVWTYEDRSGQITRIPSSAGRNFPIWSPDGHSLIEGGAGGMDWLAADGGGTIKPLTHSSTVQIPWSFTHDGTRLAYHELNSTTGFDIWTIPIKASANGLTAGKPEPFLRTPAYETYPAFSPDGHWIAYGSNESGTWQVYVRSFPDSGRQVQVSGTGGRIARWSPNGRELFYRTDDQRVMLATYIVRSGSFFIQSLRQWWPGRLADTGVLSNFDLSADGQRIVALLPASGPDQQPSQNHVTFMFNFFDEVQRRVFASRE
jgi:Tol biopolymer transport system component